MIIKSITEMPSQLLWHIYMGGGRRNRVFIHYSTHVKVINTIIICLSQSPALNPASFKYKTYKTQCHCLASKADCWMMKIMYMLLTIHSKHGVNLLEGGKRGKGVNRKNEITSTFLPCLLTQRHFSKHDFGKLDHMIIY